MYNKKIQDLVNALAAIEELSEPIGMKYSDYEDAISLVNDGLLDEFADTICLKEDYNFFIRVGEIDEYTKLIKEYALGLQDRRSKIFPSYCFVNPYKIIIKIVVSIY